MSDPLRVQLSGPLLVFAAGFLEELLGRGYRPGTAAKQLQLMAHLSRRMAAHRLFSKPGDLREIEIERFVQEREVVPRTNRDDSTSSRSASSATPASSAHG